jgi:hypothetical protein
MIKTIISITIAAASLAAATVAQAQLRPAPLPQQRTVDLQLAQVVGNAINDGFRRIIADKRGAMFDNEPRATFLKVRLERGVSYRFAARCDEDCFDLDMALVDGRGRVVKIDTDDDDEPGFDFRPNATGNYTVVLHWAVGNDAHRMQVGATVLAN